MNFARDLSQIYNLTLGNLSATINQNSSEIVRKLDIQSRNLRKYNWLDMIHGYKVPKKTIQKIGHPLKILQKMLYR